jgi:hypothetical protein
LDSSGLVVSLGLGCVGIALVVSPLALVGRLLEVFPNLALVHFVDEGGLGLCDKDNLLDQTSLDFLLDVVDPGSEISGSCRECERRSLTGQQKEEVRAQCEESSRCRLEGLP